MLSLSDKVDQHCRAGKRIDPIDHVAADDPEDEVRLGVLSVEPVLALDVTPPRPTDVHLERWSYVDGRTEASCSTHARLDHPRVVSEGVDPCWRHAARDSLGPPANDDGEPLRIVE